MNSGAKGAEKVLQSITQLVNFFFHQTRVGKMGFRVPLCDIPSGCCSFTGPWTVTRSSLRMLRRVAAFCRPLRPVLLLVSFPRSRSPVVGVLGLCWMWDGCAVCVSAAPNSCPPPPPAEQFSSRQISRNINKVPHRATTPPWRGYGLDRYARPPPCRAPGRMLPRMLWRIRVASSGR